MIDLPQTFRASRWVIGITVMGLSISTLGLHFFSREAGGTIKAVGFAVLSLLFAAGLLESLMTRVVLTQDALEVRRPFKSTSLSPGQVKRVVAEKGALVALELREGGWFKLPGLVAGPHPNSLRAWVKRGTRHDA